MKRLVFWVSCVSIIALLSYYIEARYAQCYCKNGKVKTVSRGIDADTNVRAVCERECANESGLDRPEMR
jgi:hypothetical protein